MSDKPRYVPIKHAAVIVNRSLDTVRRWDKSGLLPNTRRGPGGRRLIYTADLEAIMRPAKAVAK